MSEAAGMNQAQIDAFMAQEGPPAPPLKPGQYIPIPVKKIMLKAAGVPDDKIAQAVLKQKAKGKMANNWIQKAINPANKGAFTAQANKAGKSVAGEANSVLKPNSKASTTTKRRAQFAINMESIANKKLAEKAK